MAGRQGRLGSTLRVLALGLIVALAVSGCSRISLAYNWFFQSALVDYVDDYSDLTRSQRRELDQRIGEFVDWHRSDALPDYASLLRDVDRRIAEGELESADVVDVVQRGEVLYRDFVVQLLDRVSPTLLGLDERQLAYMAEAFAEDNSDIEERWSGNDTVDDRVARIERGMRRWVGRLEDFQRAQIREFLYAQQPLVEGRLTRRQRWQEAFLQQLRNAESGEQLAKDLRPFFLDSQAFAEQEDRQKFEDRAGDYHAFTAAFMNQLTPRQKQRLSRQLQRFADDFDKLASQ